MGISAPSVKCISTCRSVGDEENKKYDNVTLTIQPEMSQRCVVFQHLANVIRFTMATQLKTAYLIIDKNRINQSENRIQFTHRHSNTADSTSCSLSKLQ